ncbi:hypothetical protein GPALN_002042 [Globodera pallida]|nr:hypothetical protein GPALN_002042 [Globodera pallida]
MTARALGSLAPSKPCLFFRWSRQTLLNNHNELIGELFVATERVTLDEPMPKVSAQYDYFGSRLSAQQPQTYGAGGYGGAAGGDMVNFDFQCRCQAKSALARTLSTPLTDSNQATQQHIQQLQEQVRKLQEQVNRSQQGKSAFEQFAQVLSLADGLDCNCSGASTPWMGWPSGVIGSLKTFIFQKNIFLFFGMNGGGGGFPPRGSGGVPLNGGGQFGGGVMPRMPPMGGGFGTGQPFGGIGQTFGGGQMYGPMGLRRI